MDNYHLLEKVGEGTYGCVYKARNKKTQDVVAVKILNKFTEEEGVSYAALQEVKWLKLLGDVAGVVQLLDCFVHEEKPVFVFNYADCDLTGICCRGPQLKMEEVKCLLRQILEGVRNIHARELMHRDIKAANILLHKGKVMIADLGMMTNYKAHESFSSNCITLWYRAPELLLGQTKYGPEVDIWSVGCIFIELVTRLSPFPGFSEKHQMDLIFKLIGTPNEQTWGPSVTQLPGWKTLRKNLYKPHIRDVFKNWDKEALDLLEKMLAPPSMRITAEQAIEHPFFFSEPFPCENSQLPNFGSVHEMDVKKKAHPRDEQPANDLKRQKIVHPPAQPSGVHPPLAPKHAQSIPRAPSAIQAHGMQKPPHVHTNAPLSKPMSGQKYPPMPTSVHGRPVVTVSVTKQPLPMNGKYPNQPMVKVAPVPSKPPMTHVQRVLIPPQKDTQAFHMHHGALPQNSTSQP